MLRRQKAKVWGKSAFALIMVASLSGCGLYSKLTGVGKIPVAGPIAPVAPTVPGVPPTDVMPLGQNPAFNPNGLSAQALAQSGINPNSLMTPDAAQRFNDPVFATLQQQNLGGQVMYDPSALQQGALQQGAAFPGSQMQSGFQQIASAQTLPQQLMPQQVMPAQTQFVQSPQFAQQQIVPSPAQFQSQFQFPAQQAAPQGIMPNAVAGFQQAAPQYQVKIAPSGQQAQSMQPQTLQLTAAPQQVGVMQQPSQSSALNSCPALSQLSFEIQQSLAPIGVLPSITADGKALGFEIPVMDVAGGKSIANAQTVLPALARTLSSYQTVFAQIIGHTKKSGNDRYEMTYTDTVAAYIGQQLASYGVPSSQIQTVGFGSRMPSATGMVERAEFRITRAANCEALGSSLVSSTTVSNQMPVQASGQVPAQQPTSIPLQSLLSQIPIKVTPVGQAAGQAPGQAVAQPQQFQIVPQQQAMPQMQVMPQMMQQGQMMPGQAMQPQQFQLQQLPIQQFQPQLQAMPMQQFQPQMQQFSPAAPVMQQQIPYPFQ